MAALQWADWPEELLLSIFSAMPIRSKLSSLQVCKRWHQTLSQPKNWRCIDFSQDTDVTDAVLERLLQRYGDVVEHLNVNNCRTLSEGALNRAVDSYLGGNLKELSVANTAITCPILHELPGIQHVDIAGADLQDVCHASLLPTGAVLPEPAVARLKSVRLGYLNEKDWNSWYPSLGTHRLFLHIVLKYHAQTLKRLWFGGSLYAPIYYEHSLRQLDQCQLLEELSLPYSLVPEIRWTLPALKVLNLRACFELEDAQLQEIMSNAPLLESVNLSCNEHLSAEAVIQLVQQCQHLKSLDVCYAKNVNAAEVVNAILALPPDRTPFTQLGVSGFSSLRDHHVVEFCRRFGKHITLLGFGGCDRISNQALQAIAAECPNLRSLVIHQLKVTPLDVISVLQACPRLVHLSPPVPDSSIDEAATLYCPNWRPL